MTLPELAAGAGLTPEDVYAAAVERWHAGDRATCRRYCGYYLTPTFHGYRLQGHVAVAVAMTRTENHG